MYSFSRSTEICGRTQRCFTEKPAACSQAHPTPRRHPQPTRKVQRQRVHTISFSVCAKDPIRPSKLPTIGRAYDSPSPVSPASPENPPVPALAELSTTARSTTAMYAMHAKMVTPMDCSRRASHWVPAFDTKPARWFRSTWAWHAATSRS